MDYINQKYYKEGINTLHSYYRRFQELKDYENADIIKRIVDVFSDYLIGYLVNESDIITLNGAKMGNKLFDHQTKINKIFKDLGIVQELKSHLFEIIYYGQYCIKYDYDKETQKYVKYPLENPCDVVSVIRHGKTDRHLVGSRDGILVEVGPDSIIRLGSADFHIIDDMEKTRDLDGIDSRIVRAEGLVTGSPLYYNLFNKVKEYILRDQTLSLLSVKELVLSLITFIYTNKTMPSLERQRIIDNIDDILNKYSDMPFTSATDILFDKLIEILSKHVYSSEEISSVLGGRGDTNLLAKVVNFIYDIKKDQRYLLDNILISTDVPNGLMVGDVSKDEAIRDSWRLYNRVKNYVFQITDGLIDTAAMFYHQISGEEIEVENVKCNIFDGIKVRLFDEVIPQIEMINDSLESICFLVDNMKDIINKNAFINKDAVRSWGVSKIKGIGPDILEFVKVDELLNGDRGSKLEEGEHEKGRS